MIILFEIYFNVPDFTYPRRPSGPCRTWTTSNHRYGEYEGMIVTTIFYVDGSDAYTEILMSSWKHFKSWMKSPCHPYDLFFLIYNYILKLFFLFLFLLVWYVNIFWTSPKKAGWGGGGGEGCLPITSSGSLVYYVRPFMWMCSELNDILSFVQVDKEPLTVKVGHLKASCLYYVFFPNGMIICRG